MAQATYPPDAEVVASAEAAIGEIRGQIDHQSTDAAALDTKAAALFTLVVAGAGLVASRVHLDGLDRVVLGAITFLVLLWVLWCAAQSIRPRDGFSYGADARSLVELVDRHSHKEVALAMCDSLRDARERNKTFLERRSVPPSGGNLRARPDAG